MPEDRDPYNLERVKRQPLTKRNLSELGIDESILKHPKLLREVNGVKHEPVGFSINKFRFGSFRDSDGKDFKGTAFDLGWITYMHLGEPLIEELSNIEQPPPDTFSSRVYVNRDQNCKRSFQDSVDFTVSNVVNWNLQGQLQVTFGAKTSASLALQLQNQFALALANQLQESRQAKNTNSAKGSPNNTGQDNSNETSTTNQATNTTTNTTTHTIQGTATGTAELSAQLMLGITASTGGSLTTTWNSKSQVSGEIKENSRVEVLVTQRRVRKLYSYEIPVTFSGFFAVCYPVPVPVPPPPPNTSHPPLQNVIACNIDDAELATDGNFRLKGLAEIVSCLDVDHTIFQSETLAYSKRASYKT